jgi:hypothetical protein
MAIAIGFIHPSELLIFAVALRSVRLCRYDLLADTG